MKKFLTAIIAVLLMLSLFACGTPEDTTNPDDTATAPTSIDVPDTPVDEVGNGKHVVAIVMGGERTAAYSGSYSTWNNPGKELKHQPDKVDENGLRDIASTLYPSIGLYDVTDPDYQEYMMQLCKMTYVDTINYYIENTARLNEGAWWGDNLKNNVIPMLRKYGLNSTARLTRPINSMSSADDTASIINAFSNIINTLDDTVLKIDGRPVLAQFTMQGVNAQTVEDWKIEHFAKYGVVPFFMLAQREGYLSEDWLQSVDGYFGWVDADFGGKLSLQGSQRVGDYKYYVTAEQAIINHDLHVQQINELVEQGKISFYSESVTPGFDDVAVWAWGNSEPRKIERGENCELYVYKWQSVIKNNAQMVTIPTWEDWGESSGIEPTLQYGVDYLEATRKYAAEYKGIEANTASLELPGWIYKIRKTTEDKEILAVMDTASQLIADSKYDEAEALVRPYVTSLNIPATSKEFFNYPTTPTTPLNADESDEGKTPTVNGDTEIWTPTADTYVTFKNQKETDAGKEDKIRIKSAYATNLTRHAFIQFDTSASTFEGASKATLRIYCSNARTSEYEVAGRDINVYASNADWKEESFSWLTQPERLEKVADTDNTAFRPGNWIEIDVTEYLKNNFGKKISFLICNEGADTEENHVDFSSKESGKNAPQLIIEKGEKIAEKPTTETKETTLIAIADTHVTNSGERDAGSESIIYVKKMDASKRTRNLYVKFDTAALGDAKVVKATLKLYCNWASTQSANVKSRYIAMYATSSDWQENSFTWNTQPAVLEKIYGFVDTTKCRPEACLEIDVTEYVKANSGKVLSFSLWNEGTDHEEGHISFFSREKAGFEPQLIIVSE